MENPALIIFPIVAVVLYLCVQGVVVTIEVDTLINKDIDNVFSFAKDPANQQKIQDTITNIKVYDHESSLDDKVGTLRETYYATVQQVFPHYSGVTYNFTRTASSSDSVIQTEGYVLGISYTSVINLVKKTSKQTEVREVSKLTLPRIWSIFISPHVKLGHQQRMDNLKKTMEAIKG